MCGISGYVDLKKGVDFSILRKMTDIINYRGPDDEGYSLIGSDHVWHARGRDTVQGISYQQLEDYKDTISAFIGFGHRRLSIQDLSELGHQPMEKHNKILVYNGEIYNYLELKSELEENGYTFISRCDTEVLLSAYDCWGTKCVEHFNGMWAFAIYDCEKRELFLSRDRFGVKPFYYYFDGKKLLFSSEIKQILCDERIPRIVNKELMAHFLRYNFREYNNETFFHDIYALPGGCNAVIELDFENQKIGEMKVTRYYDLLQIKENEDIENPEQIVGKELRRAIKLRMRSDVKLGSCLSGGMDSSSIVGIISDELKKVGNDPGELSTVTSSFEQEMEIDETYFSKKVLEFCGGEENLVKPDCNSLMEDLEKIVWHQDEPIHHLGMEVSYAVFKKASELGCKVFFDGQGGDEGLTGYYFYYANYLWNILKKNNPGVFLKKLREVVKSSGLSTHSAVAYMLYFNLSSVRNLITSVRRNKYLSKNVLNSINRKKIQTFFSSKDGLERQQEDFLYGSLPSILHIEDRNSMASSVETRLPFLDYQYVEEVLRIPVMKKVKDGFTKKPLRDSMQGLLPEEVIWRKNKLGFPAPHRKWLFQMPQSYVIELLDHAKSAPLFNIKRIKKEYLQKKGSCEMAEKFIAVELWTRIFDVQCGLK